MAVFKPIDEEPNAPNNPRGLTGVFGSDTCRSGVKSGESTLREVAAYLIDHNSFSGVPPTALIELNHESLPSISISEDQVLSQEYVDLISDLIQIKRSNKKFEYTIEE